ncbi:hypothetical protein [Oceanobacillus luteolus]|uniref:Uncharacterized protein n=1 Tax=Oceanobacillus luteolus TaxID=1274358 RepID=A0ABW4HQB0_9BACI
MQKNKITVNLFKTSQIHGYLAFLFLILVASIIKSLSSGLRSNKLSTHQLIKIIVAESWNTYVHFDGEEQYPNMKRIFEQIYNYTLLKYYIATKISLKNSLFYKGKIGRIFYLEQELGTKTQPFVIFQLKSFNLTEEDTYDINMINPISGDTYTFTAKRDVVERSKQKNRVDSDYCIVGGFVKSSGKGKNPEFISLGVLPVNQNGVVIESSYEKKLYDLLCEKKRLFQRPINAKYHPKWDGLVPDGLLIDTQPHTIIEVFGMSEDHIDYHLHREYKIKHYESIVDSYRLWYWDAFKDSNIPTLPLQR